MTGNPSWFSKAAALSDARVRGAREAVLEDLLEVFGGVSLSWLLDELDDEEEEEEDESEGSLSNSG